jgi:hypothetical protein
MHFMPGDGPVVVLARSEGKKRHGMTSQRRILIVAKPELSRSLETPLRHAGWSVYRSPDLVSLSDAMRSIVPHVLLVGLDAPWFDASALHRLASASSWNVPIIALTSLTTSPVDGPITFLPSTMSVAEIARRIDQTATNPA